MFRKRHKIGKQELINVRELNKKHQDDIKVLSVEIDQKKDALKALKGK